jgi:hypothetical protein
LDLLALGFLVLAIAVALALPADILSRSASARWFTDALATHIAAIDSLGRLSEFPEVTRFFHALMAVAATLLGIAFTLASPTDLPFRRSARERPVLMLLTFVLLGAIFAVTFWAPWEVTPERLRDPMGWGHAVIDQMSRYRLALGFWGAVFWGAWAGVVWMLLLLFVESCQRRPSQITGR